MDKLPTEIIEKILKSPKVSIKDVINFSSTNSYYRNMVIDNNTVWKQKFLDKWPQFAHFFNKRCHDYFLEIQEIGNLKQQIYSKLETMSARLFKKRMLSDADLKIWNKFVNGKQKTYHYLVFHLMSMVNTHVPIKNMSVVTFNTSGNKTLQYYASKVLRHIRQLDLRKVWGTYIALPESQQLLECGAAFVAQWYQPNTEITYKSISKKLDDIAEQVKIQLKMTNPDHPVFKTHAKVVAKWRNEKLTANQWTVPHCKEILNCINDVLFRKIQFTYNNIYDYAGPDSCINKALETKSGSAIILLIIYESIARRLGLLCEPIDLPEYFMLRFTESGLTNSNSYFIDVVNGGNIIREYINPSDDDDDDDDNDNVEAVLPESFPVATSTLIIEHIGNDITVCLEYIHSVKNLIRVRSCLELLYLVNPDNLLNLIYLAEFYMEQQMDMHLLQNVLRFRQFEVPEDFRTNVRVLLDYKTNNKHNEIKLNSPKIDRRQIKYAVGMIMTHTELGYKCVIYDWDSCYMFSSHLQKRMKLDQSLLKVEEPIYKVLIEDGSHMDVLQKYLVPATDVGNLCFNEEIGRYFSHFNGFHFVPNVEKELEYPADKEVRSQYYEYEITNL